MALYLRRRARLERFFQQRGRMSSTRWVVVLGLLLIVPGQALAQSSGDFVPVTDAMLDNPAPGDWLTWRRTPDGWGYSPLEQIDRRNVGDLRMVWSRALSAGRQEGTPLVYNGVMYMPNPEDVIQAIDAVTGDLIWEHRRQRPDDLTEFVKIGSTTNRNIAIYDNLIIDTSTDDYVFALDAATGRQVWETQILDYTKNPAHQTSGPDHRRRKDRLRSRLHARRRARRVRHHGPRCENRPRAVAHPPDSPSWRAGL